MQGRRDGVAEAGRGKWTTEAERWKEYLAPSRYRVAFWKPPSLVLKAKCRMPALLAGHTARELLFPAHASLAAHRQALAAGTQTVLGVSNITPNA